MDGTGEKYCVVGVRADRSQHLLSMKLSGEDADYLRETLLRAGIFQEVFIQPEDPQSTLRDTAERVVSLIPFGNDRAGAPPRVRSAEA
jgi:hypothetical protein